MLKRFAEGIVKRRKIVLIIFVVLFALSAVSVILIQDVNSDITTYLPSDSMTSKGQLFLKDNFGIKGDVMLCVADTSIEELTPYAERITALDSVTGVNWIGSSTFSLLSEEQYDKVYDIFVRGEMYCMLITLDYVASTPESFEALADIEAIMDESGMEYSVAGSTEMSQAIMEGTVGEVVGYAIVAVAVVLIILFLCTGSWLEPLVLLLTLGVSIIINMGTNFMLGQVSVITFSASAILQLGLAMDYAIFMLHSYNRECKNGLSAADAIVASIPKTFITVFSSALTTIGGFAALYFMEFGIGADLAKVLIKGIVLSMVSVLAFEPCLLMMLEKPLRKSQHKYLNLHFKRSTALAIKHNILFVILIIGIGLPAVYYQGRLDFNYLKFEETPEVITPVMEYANDMENQLVIAVPIDSKNMAVQYELVNWLESDTRVDYVLGLASMMDESTATLALTMYELSPDVEQLAMLKSYVNNGYSLYTICTTIEDNESAEGLKFIEELNNKLTDMFGDTYYLTGTAQAVYDFARYTPTDFKTVSIISIVIIFVILLFAFRKVWLSVLLIALIEVGIFINLGLSAVLTGEINFMSYIIISSIQLGATVDYAILISTSFQSFIKKGMHPRDAAFNAVTENAMSVLTSAGIMIAACLSVYFMASVIIVGEITMLIARGSAISCGLVLLILPCILTFMGRITDRIKSLRQNN